MDGVTGTEAAEIAEQTYLVNATQVMLNVAAGTREPPPAPLLTGSMKFARKAINFLPDCFEIQMID